MGDVLLNFVLDQLVPLLLPVYPRLFWRNEPLPKPSSSFFLSGDGDEVRRLSKVLPSHPSRSGWKLLSDKRGKGRGG